MDAAQLGMVVPLGAASRARGGGCCGWLWAVGRGGVGKSCGGVKMGCGGVKTDCVGHVYFGSAASKVRLSLARAASHSSRASMTALVSDTPSALPAARAPPAAAPGGLA